MLKFSRTIYIGFALILSACSDTNEIVTPEENGITELPSIFEINWNKGGGMVNRSEHIYISQDSASWILNRYNQEVAVSWKPIARDIDALYTILNKNHVNQIKSTSKGQVHDRGGITMSINIDGVLNKIDNSGSYFIEEKWRDNYNVITTSISEYVNKEVENSKIGISIGLNEGLFKVGYQVKINLNDARIFDFQSDEPISTIKENCYVGLNQFNVSIYKQDSLDNSISILFYKSEMIFVDIQKEKTSVNINFEDDNISVTKNE